MSEAAQATATAIFREGSEANHRALEELAEILRDIGFSVRKKSPNETTLRVYVKKQNQYPLLNPRFIDGRLEVTVLSKGADASLDSMLASFQNTAECTFEPLRESSQGYRYHGVFVMPLNQPERMGLSVLMQPLKAIHNLLTGHA